MNSNYQEEVNQSNSQGFEQRSRVRCRRRRDALVLGDTDSHQVKPQVISLLNEEVVNSQIKIKRSANLLKYIGIALTLTGCLTIAGNMLFLSFADQYSSFYWFD